MKDYEEVPGGVRKNFVWGYVIVYAPFADCFTQSELIEVLKDMKAMLDVGIKDPKLDKKMDNVKLKLKATL